MNTILISDAAHVARVSAIAFENYRRLRDLHRWMPEKKIEDFIPRIEWMTREGRVYGLEDGETVRAFIGWFKIENYRNLGSGALALSALDASLARHISDPPVLMSDTRGDTVDGWVEWLADPDTVTFVAESAEGLVGFVKADPPHFDVSWFVHDTATLAVCGLYVEHFARGMNVASSLLRALVTEGVMRGYSLISVDCETHNPEARSFWLSRFGPVSWTFERRF